MTPPPPLPPPHSRAPRAANAGTPSLVACLPRAELVGQAAHLLRAIELLPEHLDLPLLVRGRRLVRVRVRVRVRVTP